MDEKEGTYFGKDTKESNYFIGGYEIYDKDTMWNTVTSAIEKNCNPEEIANGIHVDLGCAFGYLLKRSPFRETIGGDISFYALQRAKEEKEKKQEANGTLENERYSSVFQFDGNSPLPFKNASVECVTALDFVEHTKDRSGTIRDIARILKDGGLFIVGTPTKGTLEGRIVWNNFDKDPTHVSIPTSLELVKDLEESGFEIVEMRYYSPTIGIKAPFPRTNIEMVAIKTNKSPEELRDIHRGRFPMDRFLQQDR